VWAWGANYQGALGNGVECDPAHEICESRVPVQVSNLDDVTKVAGFAYGGYALRADGTVWAWGFNGNGNLGNNGVSGHSAVPVPVVGVSGVSDIGAGWESGFALVPNP
jgi:alpha-tubulin suppressor-like RCC1 family protein